MKHKLNTKYKLNTSIVTSTTPNSYFYLLYFSFVAQFFRKIQRSELLKMLF